MRTHTKETSKFALLSLFEGSSPVKGPVTRKNLHVITSSRSGEIASSWMPNDFFHDKSTLVQVMAWCRQATSHYLSQCWPRSMSPYGHHHSLKDWNGNAILSKFSPLTALEAVILTTYSAASGEIFMKIMTFPFQWGLLETWFYEEYGKQHNISSIHWQLTIYYLDNTNHNQTMRISFQYTMYVFR